MRLEAVKIMTFDESQAQMAKYTQNTSVEFPSELQAELAPFFIEHHFDLNE